MRKDKILDKKIEKAFKEELAWYQKFFEKPSKKEVEKLHHFFIQGFYSTLSEVRHNKKTREILAEILGINCKG